MTASPVMSITDELVAELEGLANVNHAYVPVHPPVMRAMLAERVELKKDAERYRWLNNPNAFLFSTSNELWKLHGSDSFGLRIDINMQAAQ